MDKKKYFDILQIFRGIASLIVFIHHTYGSFSHSSFGRSCFTSYEI